MSNFVGLLDKTSIEQKEDLVDMKELTLTQRQLCDLELLISGGFSPLTGFMYKADYESVLKNMRLQDGTLWPMPITLDVSEEFAKSVNLGGKIALREPEGVLVAVLTVSDLWRPDKSAEAKAVFGADDLAHPGVSYLHNESGNYYLGGRVEGVQAPAHYDFRHLRHTPKELKANFQKLGWRKIVAFQTRNPMHRAHQELTIRAAKNNEANLLIHPVVGMTKPGDIDHYTRVRCYEKMFQRYPEQTTMLSLLPLAMRMGGPREALWHAIIRKNYGCTHFIVGRDHAGPGKNSEGNDFYGPYDAQVLIKKHEKEIGIEMIPFQEVVYVQEKNQYLPKDQLNGDETVLSISGTEFRRRLREGIDVPEWFSYPEIIEELRKTHPPKLKQGFVVFFTGLSGAGKSTIANALMVKLLEIGGRSLTLLDGDLLRKQALSKGLGFSKEDRNTNVKRIGFVASEIAKHGGVAICAPIAPYEEARLAVREMVDGVGAGFVEVYVSTSLQVCEKRDRKGLYKKARAGKIKQFTGIDDPYEAPINPELVVDAAKCHPDEAVQKILLKLESFGYL
jgi:sulfate adenylyltransferase